MTRCSQPSADADTATRPIPGFPVDLPGIIAVVAVGALVLALGWFKVASLDVGYHVAYGRQFLDTGHIVGQDPFLLPETARPFINANWGSQVVMALVERATGAWGLMALRLVLIAIAFACVAVVVRTYVRGWLAVAAVWMLAAVAAYERFSMRPELFSYALMSLQLLVLTRGVKSWRSILTLALLQVLWVNMHSYFVVGLLLTAAWLAAAVGRVLFKGRANAATGDHAVRRAKLMAVCLLAQFCACLVNPWFVRGATFPFATLRFLQSHRAMGGAAGDASDSAWSEISEFQSPLSFSGQIINHRTIQAYYVLLGAAGFGVLALLIRGRIAEALVIVFLILMSLKMRRNIAQFALIGAPLAVGGLAVFVPWTRLRPPLRRTLSIGAAVGLVALAGWWTAAVADGRFYYAERRVSREFGTGYSDRTFPRRAVQWLAEHEDLKPNLFVDYFTSSNTLQWLPRRFKLFVDTNTFAYEDATLATAFKLGLGEIDHGQFFDAHKINVVLLHCGPDTQVLIRHMIADQGDWALVYLDQYDLVFVRRIMAHVPVIQACVVGPESLDAERWVKEMTGPALVRALSLGTVVNVPMSLGWWRPAIVLLKEAVRLAPGYYELWHYLGVCHGNLGNAAARSRDYDLADQEWALSVDCFEKVLSLAPDHRASRDYLALTQQKRSMLRKR